MSSPGYSTASWAHAKLAIGRFATPETGEYWGVNAEVIGGKLIVGNNLVIENYNEDMGVMQFKVDASGAWLNNATLCVQCDQGGKLLLDPRYGFAAGTGDLYDVAGDTVKPSFIQADGSIKLDSAGIPENANFYLDSRTGKAYFRGDGVFSGTIYAIDGEFAGKLKAPILEGTLVGDPDSGGWLEGCGIKVGANPSAPNGYNFYVDPDGNVVINSGSISWGAVTGTDEIDQRIQDAQDTADAASDDAASVNDDLIKLVQGTYSTPKSTFIDGKTVKSPTIEAGSITSAEITGGTITGTEIYGSSIYGGAFYDSDGKAKLVLNPNGTRGGYADMAIYGGGSGTSKAFEIYDVGGSIDLLAYGVRILSAGSSDGKTRARGDWDFSGANVTGITAVFV